MRTLLLLLFLINYSSVCLAGSQQYELMSAAIRESLQGKMADEPPKNATPEAKQWSRKHAIFLNSSMDGSALKDTLWSIHYEATRSGIDPSLVLAIIQVESVFRKYAVSSAGAQGLMQVMPFWKEVVGKKDQSLFSIRTNIRYGCVIFRHYLDNENGDLVGALSRYNGSKKDTHYADAVLAAYKKIQAAKDL